MKPEQLADVVIISEKNFPYFERQSSKSKPLLIQHPAAVNQKTNYGELVIF